MSGKQEYLKGEKFDDFMKKIHKLQSEGLKISEIMQRLGISRSTLQRRMKKIDENNRKVS